MKGRYKTMTTTTLTPTDESTVFGIDPFDLDEIASEIKCISSNVYVMSTLVIPKEMQDIDTMSEKTMTEVFYSIMCNLEGVADRLIDLEKRSMKAQKTTTTPTDENKDCR